MIGYKNLCVLAVWLLFLSSAPTRVQAAVASSTVPSPLDDTSPPTLPDLPSLPAPSFWGGPPRDSPPSPIISPLNLNKSLIFQLAGNLERTGRTLVCLADQTNDPTVIDRINQVFDSGLAYLKETYYPPTTDQGAIDMSNLLVLNTLVYFRGIHEKCAFLTDPYTPSNTPDAGKNLAELGNIFQAEGTTLDCLLLKLDVTIIPRIPGAFIKAMEGMLTDPRLSSMDVVTQNHATLLEDLQRMSRACLA